MTQNAQAQPDAYSEEEVRAAEAAEQAALSKSQNQYLTRRVVALRAQIGRLERENSELRLELHNLQAEDQKEPGETPEG